MPFAFRNVLLCCCFFFLGLSACSDKPVRHLASDVGLIQVGTTDRDSVLRFLGEPDSRRMISDTREEWIYHEEKKSTMQKVPLMGEAFDADGYQMVKIILDGDLVSSCDYGTFNKNKEEWPGSTSE